ncbi:MAG TPA: TlpA disulfide reductase family protein [Thermoanaerobaculia bacterium]
MFTIVFLVPLLTVAGLTLSSPQTRTEGTTETTTVDVARKSTTTTSSDKQNVSAAQTPVPASTDATNAGGQRDRPTDTTAPAARQPITAGAPAVATTDENNIESVSTTLHREKKPRVRLDGKVIELKTGYVRRLRDTFALVEAQKRNKNVLLILWATWCAPCIAELPDLDELQRTTPDLYIVGLLDELPTETSKATAGKQLADWKSLRFHYYIKDAAVKRELFHPIVGDRDALPSFVFINRNGERITDGRGAITAVHNKAALALIRGRSPVPTPQTTVSKEVNPQQTRTVERHDESLGRRFGERCAAKLGLSFDELTSEARRFYARRRLTDVDFEGSLASLQRTINDPARRQSGLSAQTPPADRTITFWVDVTCIRCAEAAETVRAVARATGASIDYEVIGAEPVGEKAAATLELIKRRQPSEYIAAVEQFLAVLPGRPSALDGVAADYLGVTDPALSPGWLAYALT